LPTYDYECSACGHAFEKFQSMSARVLRKCPECGERKLERLIGPGAGFIFKGDGFYATDYRSDSYKSAEKKDDGGATKASKDGEASKSKDAKKDGGSGSGSKTDSKD
jgi:putative FmdB family regulatory protein